MPVSNDKLGVNPTLNAIATQLALEQAIKNKQEEATSAQGVASVVTPDDDVRQVADNDDESDNELSEIRRKRREQLEAKHHCRRLGSGTVEEIPEDRFLSCVTTNESVVCVFYVPEFPRCLKLITALEALAALHQECVFIKVRADKALFFTDKLNIRTLPTLVGFVDGVAKMKLIGFDEFGKGDEFKLVDLARRLARSPDDLIKLGPSVYVYNEFDDHHHHHDDDDED